MYADELLSITLELGPHGSDNVRYVARVFMAIKKSTEQLRELYKNLLDPSPSLRRTKPLWPSPTTEPPDSAKRIPKLEYFSKANHADGTELFLIDEDNERHALYLARMQTETSTQDVFVKFATSYNGDAHRLLAKQNPPLAPTLHFCERVIGHMHMVVMEYIPRSKCRSIRRTYGSQLVPEIIQRDVTKALDLLHKQDIVFGDLREENLLYLPEDGGCVMLVGFDAAGRDGEDRYSPCFKHDWRLDVSKWQIMRKADDDEHLEQLMKRLFDGIY